jgi:small subunit ribosomal protein S4
MLYFATNKERRTYTMRDTGSVWKKSRYLNMSVTETGKELKKRAYIPGQHGDPKKKRKNSEYGKQLLEKQKLRNLYGVNERQFRRLFNIALKDKTTVTGLAFFRILETRLDNVVYRLGFATTRRAARQLVNHGLITVNGKKVDIPSYLVSVGDVVAVKESSRNLTVIKASLESLAATKNYVELDREKLCGKLIRLPERNELTLEIDEASIIEFYNRKL